MEGKFRDLEAELILEIKKVNWVEYMFQCGEIDDKLAMLEANKLASSIAEILECENELEKLFLDSYNKIVTEKTFNDFTGLVELSRLFIRYRSSKDNIEMEENLNDIPDQVKEIVEILSVDSSITDVPNDSKINLRYYTALYLIYRINENNYIIHSDEKSKKKLYDTIWGELRDDNFFDRVQKVHEAYPGLYKKDLKKKEDTNYSYDTLKDRMNKVLPTKRNPNSMVTAHNLNLFEQHAMLIHFLIYNTKYQRFLSYHTTMEVPDYDVFKGIKESMLMFQSLKPVGDVDDELYQHTVIEDTFHFTVFNGVTKLIVSILEQVIEIIQLSSQHETLITLFWLEEVNRYIPNITKQFASIFSDIKDEIGKYHELDNLTKAVDQATEDETTLAYSKDKLKELLEKYDSIHEEDGSQIDSETTEAIFKLAVKLFYQYEDDETAYQK